MKVSLTFVELLKYENLLRREVLKFKDPQKRWSKDYPHNWMEESEATLERLGRMIRSYPSADVNREHLEWEQSKVKR